MRRTGAPPDRLNTFHHASPAHERPARFALNRDGRIVAADEAAALLWQSSTLPGRPLVTLLSFEVISDDPDFLEAQWAGVLASVPLGQTRFQARRESDARPFAIDLQLAPATGGDIAWFATVLPADRPAAARVDPPTAAPGNTAGDEAEQLLATSGALGFFDLDFKGGGARYSAGWKRLLGYRPEELADTYETWLALIHPEDSAAAPDRIGRRATPGRRDFSVEFRMRHRLGHFVWIQCAGLQLIGADGALERVVGVHLDLTERKELEEQSLLNDERLERLTHGEGLAAFDLRFAPSATGAPWPAGAADPSGALAWYSPAWKSLFGAAGFVDVLPEPTRPADAFTYFAGLAAGGAHHHGTISVRRADGAETRALLGVHRQFSRRHELVRVVGFLCPLSGDIAAGGLAPEPLLAAALESLSEALVVTDAQLRVVLVNAAAERLTGWTAADAARAKLHDVLPLVHRADGAPADEVLDVVLASDDGARPQAEHSLVRAGERGTIPILWTARRVFDDAGAPVGAVVVFRDPHEMSLTPEELVKANRFDALGQLAGGIAHDFNNLLTTVLGGISQARDSHDHSWLADAENACLTAKTLTRQLLAVAKGGAGAGLQVIAIAEVLRDAARLAAAGGTARVTVEADDKAGPVHADRGQLLQIFQNLVLNALQALPDPATGQVVVRAANIRLREGDIPPLPAGDYVQIEVQDNGAGIPPEQLDRIFEPFFTTKKTGTGLGLATVLSLVRKFHGQVGVSSPPGEGTTFTVFLPVVEKPFEEEARRAPALRFGTGRILFMDDDPKICELTGGMLTSLDYTFDSARNGEEVLALYRRYLNVGRPYDAVILDLTVVGGMGGEECFHQLRALDPEVRAIVNTGYDHGGMAARFLDMGFCGYLTKPYRVGDLGRILKTVLADAQKHAPPMS